MALLVTTIVFLAGHFTQAQDNGQDIASLACESTDSVYEFNTASGIIQTPNFPDNYNNYENCMWYINPSDIASNQQLYLEIDMFETENTYDKLRIYKGQGVEEADLLVDLSGTYPYGYYIPTGQSSLTVDFYSDGSTSFTGVNVTYFLEEASEAQVATNTACNETLQPAVLTNSSNTMIESLDFPLNYFNGDRCLWNIVLDNPPGGGFYLSTVSFQTGGDNLNIYATDNTTGSSPVEQWSGTLERGHSTYIDSDRAALEFVTGSSQPGFQVVYFLSALACQSGSALEILVDGYGELASPGYPYDIPEHINCRWLLRAPENQRVVLVSLDFGLHGDGLDCDNEYLEVLDGDAGDAISLGKFCGNATFGGFPSSTSAVQLYFTTYDQTDDTSSSFLPTGFKLSYEPY